MTRATSDFRHAVWQLCTGGRFSDAHGLLVKRLTRSPDDVEAWILLAKLCLQQRSLDQALAAALKAANLDSVHPDALYTLGRIHRSRGDTSAAERCYRRALDAAPDNADILTSLGVLLRARGAVHDAIASYRRALAVNPLHPEAANNLGNALASLGAVAEASALHDQGRPALAAQMAALCNTAEEFLAVG